MMSIAAGNDAQKRTREYDAEFDSPLSPNAKRARYDLFDILDDVDTDPAIHDLDSVIRSLEEEISASSSSSPVMASQPELGYLLEASDDELGLPPSLAASKKDDEAADVLGFGEIWGFEEADAAAFEAVEFGGVDDGSEYLALDGLFDYSDVGFGSTDISWRSDSMPAQ